MSRFFVKPQDVEDKYIYLTDKQDLHHISNLIFLLLLHMDFLHLVVYLF